MAVLCGEHWMFWESLPAPQTRPRPSRVTRSRTWLYQPCPCRFVWLVQLQQVPLGRALGLDVLQAVLSAKPKVLLGSR